MKRSLLAFTALCFMNIMAKAQLISQNFSSGLPPGWTQNPASGWSWNASFGGGCAITSETGSSSGNRWLQTTFIDLSSVTGPVLTFKTALVRNNFVTPGISLWFDTGGGWQYIARWGQLGGPNVTYTINWTSDSSPPLDASNVSWQNVTYDLSSLVGNANIRFAFGGDFSNGGYVLLDEVKIEDTSTVNTTGIVQDPDLDAELELYPNPAHNGKMYLAATPALSSASFLLYNSIGEQVKDLSFCNLPNRTLELDFSGIPRGIYYLHVLSSADKRSYKKIVVD